MALPQAAAEHDLERAIPTVETDRRSVCRPTISAIDAHFDGSTQRYPRSLREDETKYISSLPPLARKCARIYLREEDCRARDAFAIRGTHSLEGFKQLFQLCLGTWQRWFSSGPVPISDLIESAIAGVLENSGVDRRWFVHETDRFDIWDLRNLFDHQDQASQAFLVQLNVEASQAPERAIFAPTEDKGMIKKKLNAGRFNGNTIFWEKYASLKICQLEDQDSFEVHCWFPALSYYHLPKELSDKYVFPLLIQFEQLLCSDNSLVMSSIEDPSIIQSYIVLDYLRCVTLSWLNFLKRVNHAPGLASSRILTQSEHDNDNRVTASLQNAVNDLKACVSYILDRTAILHDFALTEQSVSKTPSERSSRKYLLMVQDLRAQLEYLSRRSSSLRERSQQLFELDNAATSNSQAQSAGRLTVVASIFLPLTLAASLLAMNVPAASIGRLWYDFAGLCICIAFICFAGYSAYRQSQTLSQSDSFINAYQSFSKADFEEPDRTSKAAGYLLHWGFPAIVVASFLAGMFHSFSVALDALKYGLPILLAILVLYQVVHFTRFDLPTLKDSAITTWFVMKVYSRIQERDASGTVTNNPNPGLSVPLNHSTETTDDAITLPNLNKRIVVPEGREILVSIAEAIQNIMANRPACQEKPMVGLMQQIIQEYQKLDKFTS